MAYADYCPTWRNDASTARSVIVAGIELDGDYQCLTPVTIDVANKTVQGGRLIGGAQIDGWTRLHSVDSNFGRISSTAAPHIFVAPLGHLDVLIPSPSPRTGAITASVFGVEDMVGMVWGDSPQTMTQYPARGSAPCFVRQPPSTDYATVNGTGKGLFCLTGDGRSSSWDLTSSTSSGNQVLLEGIANFSGFSYSVDSVVSNTSKAVLPYLGGTKPADGTASSQTVTVVQTRGYHAGTQNSATLWNGQAGIVFKNILEELSAPGQFYIDRISKQVYWWPPSADWESKRTYLTVNNSAVLQLAQSGLTVDTVVCGSRNDCVQVTSAPGLTGSIASRGAQYKGIRFTDAGSTDCTLSNVTVEYNGSTGLVLRGGTRANGGMVAGNNTVTNLTANFNGDRHDYYSGHLWVGGMGHLIDGFAFADCPHLAVRLSGIDDPSVTVGSANQDGGNDIVIRNGTITRACQFGTDSGAYYQGQDASLWGNRLENLTFSDYATLVQPSNGLGPNVTMGIYFDDNSTGVTVDGCTLIGSTDGSKLAQAVLHNGGCGFVFKDIVCLNNHKDYELGKQGNWSQPGVPGSPGTPDSPGYLGAMAQPGIYLRGLLPGGVGPVTDAYWGKYAGLVEVMSWDASWSYSAHPQFATAYPTSVLGWTTDISGGFIVPTEFQPGGRAYGSTTVMAP